MIEYLGKEKKTEWLEETQPIKIYGQCQREVDNVQKLQEHFMNQVMHEWVHVGDFCNCKKGCDMYEAMRIGSYR